MKLSSVSGLSLLLFFVVSGIFSSLATAQEVPRLPAAFTRLFAQEMERQMRYAPEQIHLFTDREVYAAGDTIWLSGWVLNDQTLEPTPHSQRLYVDLINPQLKVVQDLVLELANGTAYGSFVLSENQTSDAFFQLRAYTQWSMHFDSTYAYHRILPVWQKAPVVDSTARPNKYQLVTRGVAERYVMRRIRPPKEGKDEVVTGNDTSAADSLPSIDVAFMPEGGGWVEGIPCRMAFKALAPDGYGVEIEGDILDQNDSLVCPFRSEHLGMGSFLITPQPGKSYTARLFTGQRIELPQPVISGLVLTVAQAGGRVQSASLSGSQPFADTLSSTRSLTAIVSLSPGEIDPKRILYLVVQSPGYKPETYALRCDLPTLSVQIPEAEFPGGLTRFTLYNSKAEPLAERLCFLPLKQQRIAVDLQPSIARVDTPPDLSGARLTLKLQSKEPQTGSPISALLAISVADSLYSPSDPSSASLVTRMLLQGFLKGEVEEAQYYFSNPYDSVAAALNLVMLTHGWRGFLRKVEPGDTEKRAKESKKSMVKELSLEAEKGFGISGRITDIMNQPIPKRKISLLAQGDYSFAKDTLTNEKGQFAFRDLPLQGNTKLTLWAHKSNSKISRFNVGFELDPQQELQKPKVFAPCLPQQSIGVMALLDAFRAQKEVEASFLDSLKRLPGIQYIEEVAISAKRIIKNSYNKNGPGKADIVLDEKAMGKFDRFSNLLEVIEHEVPGFRKGYISFDRKYFSTVYRDGYMPHFVIGERPVYVLIDGGPLPKYSDYFPESPQGWEDYHNFKVNLLRSLPVSELLGVEVMTSFDNTYRYDSMGKPVEEGISNSSASQGRLVEEVITNANGDLNFRTSCVIEITTKEGKGIVKAEKTGKATTQIRGFSTPRQFYLPKYIPKEFPDRLTYHRQPTLLWVPELITSEEGKAEVSLPVGRNFARTLRVRVESYSPTGMVGSDEVYLPVGREKGTW
ncbi:MAG: hypothetical protein AB7C90_03715 [Bacteroidales bacterium]